MRRALSQIVEVDLNNWIGGGRDGGGKKEKRHK
jgi:hypothetical protein